MKRSTLPTWFLTCSLATLAVTSTAHSHEEGQAALAIAINDEGVVSTKLELGDDDVMELLGRASQDGASLFDEGPLDAAIADELPGWMAMKGDGRLCPISLQTAERKGENGVAIAASAKCGQLPKTLEISWLASQKTKLKLSALAVVSAPEGVGHVLFLTPAAPTASVKVSEPDTLEIFTTFLFVGAEHILIGWDHLAFLLALLLACSTWRRLLMVVTAFTLAHSATLALGALGLLSFPSQVVEPIIAASIAFAAAMALYDHRSGRLTHPGSGLEDRRIWRELGMCFGFGLVHGLGFASMLAESLESAGDVVLPLVSFNLGVELGQVAAVALAFPVLTLLGRKERGKKVIAGALTCLMALGIVVFIVRLS